MTMMIGIMFETAALLGASWSTEIWQLFLSQGICFGWGMGFLFIASVGLIPQWFDKRRSFANSIGAAGSGLGGLIYSLATNSMIQSVGLGWAFRILAIISLVVNGVCAILVRDRNVAIGSIHEAFALRLLKRPEFLLLLGWGCFSLIGYVVLLFSLPNYATSIGLTAQQGSVIGALLNLGQGLGRPFVGYFSDAAGRMNIALLGTFLTGFFCFVIWISAKNYGIMIFFSLTVGMWAGTYWTTISVISAEVVGLQLLPSALSIVWISLIIPSTFAEPIGLQLKTQTGDIYLHAQIFTAIMYIAAAICLWFLRAWKVSELEAIANDDAEKMEAAIKDDDAVPHEPVLTRTTTLAASVIIRAKAAKGLWAWQRV
jgi:MFS family permease